MFGLVVDRYKKLCEVLGFSDGDKSVAKVFSSGDKKEKKNGRDIVVTFVHPEEGEKSFPVCLPPKSLRGDPGKIPAEIYRTPLPGHPHGVVALGVLLDGKAPKENRFKDAQWFCVLKGKEGLPDRRLPASIICK